MARTSSLVNMLSMVLSSDNLDVEAYCNERDKFLREVITTTGVMATLGEFGPMECKTMAGHLALLVGPNTYVQIGSKAKADGSKVVAMRGT
jgi:hypothetical protein